MTWHYDFATWCKDLLNLPAAGNIAINFAVEWSFHFNWNLISRIKQKWGYWKKIILKGQTYNPNPCIFNSQKTRRQVAPLILRPKSDEKKGAAYTLVFTVLYLCLLIVWECMYAVENVCMLFKIMITFWFFMTYFLKCSFAHMEMIVSYRSFRKLRKLTEGCEDCRKELRMMTTRTWCK